MFRFIFYFQLLAGCILLLTVGEAQQHDGSSKVTPRIIKKQPSVTRHSYQHDSLAIEVIQVKRNMSNAPGSVRCNAWVYTVRDTSVVDSLVLTTVSAGDSSSGIFIPPTKLSYEYFSFIVRDSSQSKLFLIDRKGKITPHIGGAYLVTKNRRYLFTQGLGDTTKIEVFDFLNKQVLFSSSLPEPISDWFTNGSDFAYRMEMDQDSVRVFDFASNNFIARLYSKTFLTKWSPAEYEFYPPPGVHCECEQ